MLGHRISESRGTVTKFVPSPCRFRYLALSICVQNIVKIDIVVSEFRAFLFLGHPISELSTQPMLLSLLSSLYVCEI